jgi:hypothetical protein
MTDADDCVQHLLYIPGGIKTPLNKVQRAKLLEELERSFCKGRLLGNCERLAARVRRRHVPVAALGCHLPATGGFFRRGCSAWEHARKDRRSAQEADQKQHAGFGNMLHSSKVYKS